MLGGSNVEPYDSVRPDVLEPVLLCEVESLCALERLIRKAVERKTLSRGHTRRLPLD